MSKMISLLGAGAIMAFAVAMPAGAQGNTYACEGSQGGYDDLGDWLEPISFEIVFDRTARTSSCSACDIPADTPIADTVADGSFVLRRTDANLTTFNPDSGALVHDFDDEYGTYFIEATCTLKR